MELNININFRALLFVAVVGLLIGVASSSSTIRDAASDFPGGINLSGNQNSYVNGTDNVVDFKLWALNTLTNYTEYELRNGDGAYAWLWIAGKNIAQREVLVNPNETVLSANSLNGAGAGVQLRSNGENQPIRFVTNTGNGIAQIGSIGKNPNGDVVGIFNRSIYVGTDANAYHLMWGRDTTGSAIEGGWYGIYSGSPYETFFTNNASSELRFQNAGGKGLIIQNTTTANYPGNIRLSNYTGVGEGFPCFTPDGILFRKETACATDG